MGGGERWPGAVPDLDGPPGELGAAVGSGFDTDRGFDTDSDGEPDTVLVEAGGDLVLGSDLDGDGLADRWLRIHADATVTTESVPPARPWWLSWWFSWWES